MRSILLEMAYKPRLVIASRTIEVERQQTVVSTGPYAVIRHPMYSAVLLICMSSPLALGSYWGLAAFAAMLPLRTIPARNGSARG